MEEEVGSRFHAEGRPHSCLLDPVSFPRLQNRAHGELSGIKGSPPPPRTQSPPSFVESDTV